MTLTLRNVRPFVKGNVLAKTNITIANNIIIAIGNQIEGKIIDCQNNICSAGYIDIHTHGGWGKDCMEATYESIDTIARYHLSTGTTSFCPTTMTASIDDTNNALNNIKAYNGDGAKIIGAHLEGPFLSKKSAGAHPPQFLLPPVTINQNFVWKNLDIATRITLAPNLENASEFCALATSKGIQVSLGHDDSIDDEIDACILSGATSVTHLYNCTSRPSRRTTPKKHLGLTELGLINDQLICEVIADNRHVPYALFEMIFKLKGENKICLVSDSLSVAGMPEGDYFIGSGESRQTIRIEDNVAVLPSLNTYAGSVTPISKMAKDLCALGYSKEACLTMATLTPAKLLQLTDRGDIEVGMLGDVNLLDDNLNITATIFNEKILNSTFEK